MTISKRRNKIITLCLCASLMISSTIWGSLAYLTDKTGQVTNTFTVGTVYIELAETVDTDGDGPNSAVTVNDNGTGKFENIVPGVKYQKEPVITVLENSADCYVRAKVTVDLYKGITNTDAFIQAFYGGNIYVQSDSGSYDFGGTKYIKTDGKRYKHESSTYTEDNDNGTYVRNVDADAYVLISSLNDDSFKSPTFEQAFEHWAKEFASNYILNNTTAGFNLTNWKVSDPTINATDKTITYYLNYNNVVTSPTDDKPLEALFNNVRIPATVNNAQAEFLENMEIKIEGHAIQADGFDNEISAWTEFDNEYPDA